MNFTDLLTDLASSANAIIRISAAKFNLTTSQAFHLLLIPFDGIPMSALAHRLGLDTSTLTRNIQKLEKLDLVIRKSDTYDRRIQRVVLTAHGIDLIESFEEYLIDQNQVVIQTENKLTSYPAPGQERTKPKVISGQDIVNGLF